MSEIAPAAQVAHHPVRWLIPVYAVLGVASLTGTVGTLLGSHAGRDAAYAGATVAFLTWAYGYIRVRRPATREMERRHQGTLSAWFAASFIAYSLLSQAPQVPVFVPALLTSLACAAALYGAVRETVR